MGKKIFALFLSLTMIIGSVTLGVSPAAVPTVHAADEDIKAWYSAEKDGDAVQFVEKGSEAYVNYEYKGNETTFNVQVEVSEAGDTVLSRRYMNVSRNSIVVSFDKEGVYTLSVMVMDGENIVASTTETLECVTGLPIIDTQPADITSNAGETVIFTVSSSTPGVSYQWYTANTLTSEGHAISGASTSQLTISAENVTDALNGTFYYCQVALNGYTINSNYATLNIINGATATPVQPSAEPSKRPGEEEEVTEAPLISPFGTPDVTRQPEMSGIPEITPETADPPTGTDFSKETDSPAETDPPETYAPSAPVKTYSPAETDPPEGTYAPSAPVKTYNPAETDPSETYMPPTKQPGHTDGPAPTKMPEKCKAKAVYSITGNKIKVSWNACGASYKISRSTKKKSGYVFKKTVKSTSYTDTKVTHGKTYYYKIQPIKAGAEIKASLTCAKVNIKPAIEKFSAKKKGNSIKVTWKYNRADYVQVYVNTGNGWSRLGKVSGKKSHCSIGVPGGYSRVKVRIRAYNKVKKKRYYSKFSKTRSIKI